MGSRNVEMALGVIGPGMVGKALIAQLRKQAKQLHELGTVFKVATIANSRKMMVTAPQTSLELSTWQDDLQRGETTDLLKLQNQLAAHANPVIVDCTASEAVPSTYLRWLEQNHGHVVTPNKRLGAGPLAHYNAVLKACRESDSKFLYEATVGAGLPIISSLQGLLRTGDEIQRIEGIFSGTLSFIFNSFGPERSFSSVVTEAKNAGYTEPDPRDDLSGMDVARKVVILARECGLQVDLSDVTVNSLVPPPLEAASSAEHFLASLVQFDGAMAEQAQAAAAEGKKLCYVGLVDVAAKKCSVTLKAYPKEHAFAQLSGSDNIVSFTTERYSAQPLIVRGPGAGSEVTAAGVFSDLVLLARTLGARC